MKPRFIELLTVWVLALAAIGCESGDLSISTTEELPPIELDRTHFEAKNIGRVSIPLSGKIPSSIDTLELSLDGGGSWKPVPLPASAILKAEACGRHCPFSFAITDLGARWSELQSMIGGEERSLLLRGSGPYGRTPPRSLTVKKLPSGYRALSAWSGGEVARSLKTSAVYGFKISSLQYEAEPRKAGAGGLGVRGRVEE